MFDYHWFQLLQVPGYVEIDDVILRIHHFIYCSSYGWFRIERLLRMLHQAKLFCEVFVNNHATGSSRGKAIRKDYQSALCSLAITVVGFTPKDQKKCQIQ